MDAKRETNETQARANDSWRRWLMRTMVLALSLATAGCTQPEPAPLRIGSVVWPGFEPLFVARNLGYLDSNEVRLVEYTSATQILSAYSNGTIDAGCLTLDEAILLAQEVPDVRVVLVFDISNGADVIMAKPEITSLKELKFHRVGAETTALGAYVLARALQIAGLTRQQVMIVPMDASEHESGFKQGRVDAVVTYEPTRTKLRNYGARQIFDSTQIPGEIVDVLVVRKSYLDANPEVVKRLLRDWYRALEYFKDKPQDAARIAARRVGSTPEEFLASLDGLKLPDARQARHLLVGQPPALLKTAQALSAVMREQSLLQKKVNPELLFDQNELTRVLP